MTVYVVLIRESVSNAKEYEEKYRKLVPASFIGRNVTPVAQSRASGMAVLEGPEIEGMAITSFPSMEEARAWYDSPESTWRRGRGGKASPNAGYWFAKQPRRMMRMDFANLERIR